MPTPPPIAYHRLVGGKRSTSVNKMAVRPLGLAALVASSLLAASPASADETISSPMSLSMDMPVVPDGHVMVAPDDCVWTDAPPSLPPGAKIAVLEGDLKAAGPFTI